jgi:two-component system cell cycle sensor histidine kinase/response regulator CckA
VHPRSLRRFARASCVTTGWVVLALASSGGAAAAGADSAAGPLAAPASTMALLAITILLLALTIILARRALHPGGAWRAGARPVGDTTLLRLGLRAARMGTWEWDVAGGTVVWSQGVESLFGLRPGAFAGTFDGFLACIHPEDRAGVAARIAEAVSSGTQLAIEHRVLIGDGSVRWLRGEGEVVRGSDGKARRVMGVVMDVTESILAKERQRAGDQRNRLVIEALHEGIILYGADAVIEAANRRAEVILGVGCDALVGRNVNATLPHFIQEDGRPFADDQLPAAIALRSGLPQFNVVMGIASDGHEQTWLSGNALPLSGEQAGRSGGVVFSFVDITERRRTDRALHESEERLRALAESVPGFIAMADRTGTLLYINHVIEPYDRNAVLGENLRTFILPEFHQTYFAALERVFTNGEIASLEIRGVGANGAPVWYFTRMGPIRNAGRIIAAVIASIDITDRKQSELERRTFQAERDRLLERLQMQLDRMPIGCLLNDKDFLITYVNPAAERIFGFTNDEVAGRHPNEFYVPAGDRETVARMFQRLARGDMGVGGVSTNTTKDGRVISCEWHNTPLFDAAGAFIGFMSMVQDVTERKQLEEQFRQSQKMEAVGKLAGGIAHDFNNLLTAIMGYSEMLLVRSVAEEVRHGHALQIKKAAERAASLTHQLLAYSRKQVLQARVINLNDVVGEMNGLLRRVIGEDVELAIALDPQLWKVKADPNQIEQALMNMAVNSRDAMPCGGRLSITTSNRVLDEVAVRAYPELTAGDFVELRVTDTGQGMEEGVRERIFEPFFTTKKVGEGTGLGLSMVFGMVKQSGGNISVTSRPHAGTSFEVLLPRSQESGTDKARRVSETALEVRGSETILLVEDDPDVRGLVKETLSGRGYQVLEAADGHAALTLSEGFAGDIHLLLSDLIMPRMGGRELAERILRLRPTLRVVFMSGYADDSLRGAVVQAPLMAFIEKPFTSTSLCARIRSSLAP